MRIGFILGVEGFAAVLYRERMRDGTLDGALQRSPWTRDSAQAHAWGIAWAERLGIGVDVARVDTRLLEGSC